MVCSNKKLIQSDDDLFMLKIAHENGGIILSADQYKKYRDTHAHYREVIDKRLIKPIFIKDKLKLLWDNCI